MWKKDERGIPLSHLPDPVARRDHMPALRERFECHHARSGESLGAA
jgi:hypothetical protein